MSRRCRSHTGIVRNVQDEMDGKLELRVMDDELVSTPDFLGYAQLEHKELLYKMPGQGWRNLDLIDDPAGALQCLHAVDATRYVSHRCRRAREGGRY